IRFLEYFAYSYNKKDYKSINKEMAKILGNDKELEEIFKSLYNEIPIYEKLTNRRFGDEITMFILNKLKVYLESKYGNKVYTKVIINDIFSYIFLDMIRAIATEKIMNEHTKEILYISRFPNVENVKEFVALNLNVKRIYDLGNDKYDKETNKIIYGSDPKGFVNLNELIINIENLNDLIDQALVFSTIKECYNIDDLECIIDFILNNEYINYKSYGLSKKYIKFILKYLDKLAIRRFDRSYRLSCQMYYNTYGYTNLDENKNPVPIDESQIRLLLDNIDFFYDIASRNYLTKEEVIKNYKNYYMITAFKKVETSGGIFYENGLLITTDPQFILPTDEIKLGFARWDEIKKKYEIFDPSVIIASIEKGGNKNAYLLKGEVSLDEKGLHLTNKEDIVSAILNTLSEFQLNLGPLFSKKIYSVELLRSSIQQVGSQISFALQSASSNMIFTGHFIKPMKGKKYINLEKFMADPWSLVPENKYERNEFLKERGNALKLWMLQYQFVPSYQKIFSIIGIGDKAFQIFDKGPAGGYGRFYYEKLVNLLRPYDNDELFGKGTLDPNSPNYWLNYISRCHVIINDDNTMEISINNPSESEINSLKKTIEDYDSKKHTKLEYLFYQRIYFGNLLKLLQNRLEKTRKGKDKFLDAVIDEDLRNLILSFTFDGIKKMTDLQEQVEMFKNNILQKLFGHVGLVCLLSGTIIFTEDPITKNINAIFLKYVENYFIELLRYYLGPPLFSRNNIMGKRYLYDKKKNYKFPYDVSSFYMLSVILFGSHYLKNPHFNLEGIVHPFIDQLLPATDFSTMTKYRKYASKYVRLICLIMDRFLGVSEKESTNPMESRAVIKEVNQVLENAINWVLENVVLPRLILSVKEKIKNGELHKISLMLLVLNFIQYFKNPTHHIHYMYDLGLAFRKNEDFVIKIPYTWIDKSMKKFVFTIDRNELQEEISGSPYYEEIIFSSLFHPISSRTENSRLNLADKSNKYYWR
ncbi:MAG: hypothetical protein ACTSVV_07165, partial [Promethearchaeota archaeon]